MPDGGKDGIAGYPCNLREIRRFRPQRWGVTCAGLWTVARLVFTRRNTRQPGLSLQRLQEFDFHRAISDGDLVVVPDKILQVEPDCKPAARGPSQAEVQISSPL